MWQGRSRLEGPPPIPPWAGRPKTQVAVTQHPPSPHLPRAEDVCVSSQEAGQGGSLGVRSCSGCHNKTLQSACLLQQTFISSQVWRLQVQGEGASRWLVPGDAFPLLQAASSLCLPAAFSLCAPRWGWGEERAMEGERRGGRERGDGIYDSSFGWY